MIIFIEGFLLCLKAKNRILLIVTEIFLVDLRKSHYYYVLRRPNSANRAFLEFEVLEVLSESLSLRGEFH